MLQEFADCSHILNYYKDEKNWARRNPKGAIYLETCVAVVMVSNNKIFLIRVLKYKMTTKLLLLLLFKPIAGYLFTIVVFVVVVC